MKKVVLHIDSEGEHREVTLKDEISIGRTDSAQIVLPDSGLSRVNTTIFRDGDEVFVVDENSTNGTFLNGERVFENPRQINDRDEITLGNETLIYVEIYAEKSVAAAPQAEKKTSAPKKAKKSPKAKTPTQKNQLPMIPIIAGLSVFLIAFLVLGVILIYSLIEEPGSGNGKPTPQINTEMLIPMRVIDPLGGEDPDDLDDLLASWENEDKSVEANDLAEVQSTMESAAPTTPGAKASELIVPVELFNRMINLAKEPRSPSGERPAGMRIRPELCCGVPKQTKKLSQMVSQRNYQQPLDYAELADKRMKRELMELPVATNIYVLDVGGNATEEEFTQFSWDTNPRSQKLSPDSPKYQTLKRLADDFDGQKYDLNNPKHRKQMKIRLLRMFNPRARDILMEFAGAYQQKFQRPLRITSLTRSMEYQISLNANNANSFKVSGKGSLPPHTSGCAFDLARKQMTTDEQNFMIEKLAEMENRGILDALIEYNANACFHIFIYDDGKAP